MTNFRDRAEELIRKMPPGPETDVRAHLMRRLAAYADDHAREIAAELVGLTSEEEAREILSRRLSPLLDEIELVEAKLRDWIGQSGEDR